MWKKRIQIGFCIFLRKQDELSFFLTYVWTLSPNTTLFLVDGVFLVIQELYNRCYLLSIFFYWTWSLMFAHVFDWCNLPIQELYDISLVDCVSPATIVSLLIFCLFFNYFVWYVFLRIPGFLRVAPRTFLWSLRVPYYKVIFTHCLGDWKSLGI